MRVWNTEMFGQTLCDKLQMSNKVFVDFLSDRLIPIRRRVYGKEKLIFVFYLILLLVWLSKYWRSVESLWKQKPVEPVESKQR